MNLLNLPQRLLPALRRLMLAQGRRIPQVTLLKRSEQAAWKVVRHAAAQSPAYRQLLREQGLDPESLGGSLPITALPVLDKHNTFGRFDLQALSGGLRPAAIADVLTSSGRGGSPFGMRLSSRDAHDRMWFDMDLGLQDAFDVDRVCTLVVNCLPMGVVFSSRATAVANVSVREDMACAVLQQLGPAFGQTLVCTDPLFVNRLLDHAQAQGLDWRALNTSFILGEEMLVESQRSHIARRVGIDLDAPGQRLVGSSFGVGELGLNLLFETRETIALRRALQQQPALAQALRSEFLAKASAPPGRGHALPSLFCFNPLRCHVEVLPSRASGTKAQAGAGDWGELCLTLLDRRAVLPLPRYATGDVALRISPEIAACWAAATGLALPWLPMVAVMGRSADRPAGQPSAEDVKQALYEDEMLAACLTGAFRLRLAALEGPQLLLQLKSNTLQASAQLRLGPLQDRLQDATGLRITVTLAGEQAFEDRPVIDHERKFRYFGT